MTRIFEIATVALSSLLLAGAYALQQAWLGSIACIVLGVFWSIFNLRRVKRLPSLCFTLMAFLAAFSLFNPAAPLISYLGLCAGLAAWDLSDFAFRLQAIEPPEAAARLEKLHLKRLGITLAIGLVVGLAGLLIHFELRFIPEFLLALLAFIALAVAIRSLIKKKQDEIGR